MSGLLGNLSLFAEWAFTQMSSVMNTILDTPALLLVVIGIPAVSFGVGLAKRLFAN